MRIALVIFHADAARGGAERYTLDLAHALASAGHDITLLAATFGQLPPAVQPVALPCHALTRLGQYLRFLNSLDAHLARHRYDIVHAMLPVRSCHVYHPHAGIAAEAIHAGKKKHPNPIARLLAQAGNQFNRKRHRFAQVERQLLAGADPPLVLCLSNYIKRAAQNHHPIAEERLFNLFNGVDLDRFNPAANTDARHQLRQCLNIAADRVVALMIAQDFQRKGLQQAIEAIARLRDPRLLLLVVGRDSTSPYRRLARTLGIAEQIRFAGPTADPIPFYHAADCFVLPTRHDPCSLVVLEALAMGLPVISTVQNGACEIMTHNQHGFVLPDPTDIAALADALHAMADPTLRQRMRDACLALRPLLSQQHHLQRLLAAYDLARPRLSAMPSKAK